VIAIVIDAVADFNGGRCVLRAGICYWRVFYADISARVFARVFGCVCIFMRVCTGTRVRTRIRSKIRSKTAFVHCPVAVVVTTVADFAARLAA
jgi:hypothetical protein